MCGCCAGAAARPRKYTVRMILSSAFLPGAWSGAAAGLPMWWTLCSVLALLAYVGAGGMSDPPRQRLQGALLAAWAAHALAIFFDISGLGDSASGVVSRGARFGFAPALSVTVWLVLTVYLLESRFLPISGMRRTLAWLGAAAVVLAWLFPGEVRPQATSPWQPLHWVLGIASYGLFGVAVLHGALLRRADRQMRQQAAAALPPLGLPLLKLEHLTFRFVAWGFAVLTAALVLGGWFADPWRWDHKAVLSMLAWLVFAALLLGRQTLGWRGPVATRWLFVGTGLLLLAYVGSRFVLEVVLHRAPL
jgi:ABC-type uncharacterized transport system permease subunit